MRRFADPLLILFLGLAVTACSGQKAVMEAVDNYHPPAIYQAVQSAAGGTPSSMPHATDLNHDFSTQREKILGMKKEAGSALEMPDKEGSFYLPDAARLETLSPALNDPEGAQKILSGDFPLADLDVLIWGRNPKIKSAKNNFRASLEAYDQVTNLDDILAQYTAFTAGSMAGVGSRENMEAIDKRFPFPGIMALKGDIVSAEVTISRQDLEIVRRKAITEARKIYWNLWYNRRAREITSQTLVLLTGLEASAQKRYASGQTPLREPILVRIQKEKLKEKVISLEEGGRNLEIRLKALLLLPSETTIGRPSGGEAQLVLPAVDKLDELARTHRQELIRLRSMIVRMEWMIEMGETRIYPGFTQNYSLSENQAINQAGTVRMEAPFKTDIPASMGAGLPRMPLTGLSEAYLRETRQRLEGLRHELDGLTSETLAKVRESWFSADLARREALLYREKLSALARLYSGTSVRAYESGDLPFAEAMDALMLDLSTQLAAERRKADLGISAADLKATVGFSWPENQEW